MKYLILISLIVSGNAMAHGNQAHSQLGNGNNINNCNPVLKCEAKTVYVYRTEKQQARIAELEAKVAALSKEKEELESNYQRALMVIHHPRVTVRVEKEEAPKNALSLLGGASPTKLEVESNGSTYKAKTVYEPDFGLMYQRDFGSIRGSIGATLRGTGLLGLGLTF